jgi:hypothetical protein
MILIAHRGNINGPQPDLENSPGYISHAVREGFDVEVDVWYENGRYMLGHDAPKYEMGSYWLYHPRLWRHAKNIEAFTRLRDADLRCFWHENDSYTMTSDGYIWAYPDKPLRGSGILVVMGTEFPRVDCDGFCSDYVSRYRNYRTSI